MAAVISHLLPSKYRPDIDGLRAVAVLSVVTFHAFPGWMEGGFIGVDIFYVISGFLISGLIFEALARGTFSFSWFYERRVRRIFPALLLVMVSCLTFGWLALTAEELNQLGRHIAGGAGFVSNLVLWSEAGYFDRSAESKPLLHLWSLSIEEQFYILWPVLLWLAWKAKFNLLALTGILATASFGINMFWINRDPVATFYSPQTRFWEILCGGMLAWLLFQRSLRNEGSSTLTPGASKHAVDLNKTLSQARHQSNGCSIAGCLLVVYGFFSISKDVSFPGAQALVPVLGALLIILAGPQAWINRHILASRLAVWIGMISYPLYLWHWPVLSFARIIENGLPSRSVRLAAVLLSVLLAWITLVLVERPLRFGSDRGRLKMVILCASMLALGGVGWLVKERDFSDSHGYDQLFVHRKGSEHAYGVSFNWVKGKDGWLFLGNAYDNTIAKLKLAIKPSESDIIQVLDTFAGITEEAARHGTRTVLMIGPDKSSIYPEFLPVNLSPSETRYISFFLDRLQALPHLTVYDPRQDLLTAKRTEGLLYWQTDTHWNHKGGYLAFSGLTRQLGVPSPRVLFRNGSPHTGDLIGISKLKNFSVRTDDSWEAVWLDKPLVREEVISSDPNSAFGPVSLVTNERAVAAQSIWVVGDSFANTLRPYFNATFKQVRHLGHWSQKRLTLADELARAEIKPDLLVIVLVERSF